PIHRDHEHNDPEEHENADAREAKKSEKPDKPARIEIDFDGIEGRVLGFPVDEGSYAQLVASKGRILFTRFEVKGIKPNDRTWDEESETGMLLAYDFEQQRCATVAG